VIELSEEQKKKIHRGQNGKWIFCLAEYNHSKYPGKFDLAYVSELTDESSAIVFFKKYLDHGGYFLLKVPERVAHLMKQIEPGGNE